VVLPVAGTPHDTTFNVVPSERALAWLSRRPGSAGVMTPQGLDYFVHPTRDDRQRRP